MCSPSTPMIDTVINGRPDIKISSSNLSKLIRIQRIKTKKLKGSSCGSVGRVIASHTGGSRFESKHRQTFILNICLLSTVKKQPNFCPKVAQKVDAGLFAYKVMFLKQLKKPINIWASSVRNFVMSQKLPIWSHCLQSKNKFQSHLLKGDIIFFSCS